MMSGPFSRLMDTNYSHCIQLEIYRYLMGAVGRKVKTNDLWLLLQATSLFTRDR
jgi:hypothetical protein